MTAAGPYFEDVNVADEISSLTKAPITEVQLVKYAGASGDFNPIHTVHHYAEKAGLGGVIAHGMLSMGFVGEHITKWMGETGTLKRLGVRFIAITRPGDVVTLTGRITGKSESDGEHLVQCELWAEKQDGTKTVTGTATVSLPSRV
ncbi:MAG: dehydratase [Candidatus Abyssobacteria bacterium SURF_17]|uniref:Dehydratase n=1 Tax=Candidatus Abyssobacteria bacterium SURF_17 TaxID=2093361 RepID=A0A419EYL2_9BACT|nr:MAG: dehydratase [Candidatus Abyssubacteria bacterium SURF_17]